MRNTIATRQNELPELRKLLAEDKPYSDAKWLHGAQVLLVVFGAAALSLLAIFKEKYGPVAAVYGALVAAADFILLEPLIASLKLRATRIRECFEQNVLQLPASPFKPALDAVEETLQWENPHQLAVEKRKLDWYPPCVQEIPIEAGRLICQRSSLEYDGRLRKGYRMMWLSSIVLIVCVLVGWAFYKDPKFHDVALLSAAVLPALLFSWNQYRLNEETREALAEMRACFDETWRYALQADASSDKLTTASRQLQDALYEVV